MASRRADAPPALSGLCGGALDALVVGALNHDHLGPLPGYGLAPRGDHLLGHENPRPEPQEPGHARQGAAAAAGGGRPPGPQTPAPSPRGPATRAKARPWLPSVAATRSRGRKGSNFSLSSSTVSQSPNSPPGKRSSSAL